MLDKQLRRFDE